MAHHRFSYNWKLINGFPAKGIPFHGRKGFTCFAGGGGSSMGYKLAGYDIIGCNDIDLKMNKCYESNLHPTYNFLCDIKELLTRKLPKEMYKLDVLDGSPPCTLFSSLRKNREKYWGKSKKYREGQKEQILDTLFFDFIALANRLKPKIVIAENVKGILMGKALKKYTIEIIKRFDKVGYIAHYRILNSALMGVPQSRERVFFFALRKDLLNKVKTIGFIKEPILDFDFKEPLIKYKDIEELNPKNTKEPGQGAKSRELWKFVRLGKSFSSIHSKGHYFGFYKVHPNLPVPAITTKSYGELYHYNVCRYLSQLEIIRASTFPQDYDFKNYDVNYIIGMSVPPIMMAQIALKIWEQWLINI